MPVSFDILDQVTADFMKPYIEREIEYWNARAAVRAGVCCMECRTMFLDLGPLGIHCNCDDGWTVKDPFMYGEP